MAGRLQDFRLVPAHVLILVLILFALLCILAVIGNAPPMTCVLHTFVELILTMCVAIVIAGVAHAVQTLCRIVLLFILTGEVQAVIGSVFAFGRVSSGVSGVILALCTC